MLNLNFDCIKRHFKNIASIGHLTLNKTLLVGLTVGDVLVEELLLLDNSTEICRLFNTWKHTDK